MKDHMLDANMIKAILDTYHQVSDDSRDREGRAIKIRNKDRQFTALNKMMQKVKVACGMAQCI
jgi:uncharacterized ubiquitin-like protein YukD